MYRLHFQTLGIINGCIDSIAQQLSFITFVCPQLPILLLWAPLRQR